MPNKRIIQESDEIYSDKYVHGIIRVEDHAVEILDWNSNYVSVGGTKKSLKLLRNKYNRDIIAVDSGYPGEKSFEYWKHMCKLGLIDGLYDDDVTFYNCKDFDLHENKIRKVIKRVIIESIQLLQI